MVEIILYTILLKSDSKTDFLSCIVRVQILLTTTCCLFYVKPLPEPMLTDCQLVSFWVKIQSNSFQECPSGKIAAKCHAQPFSSDFNVLIPYYMDGLLWPEKHHIQHNRNFHWTSLTNKMKRKFKTSAITLIKGLALFRIDCLTHWGGVTHICVVKLTIIGSDNGLSPGRRQAIIWTNAGILIIGPLETNFSEI